MKKQLIRLLLSNNISDLETEMLSEKITKEDISNIFMELFNLPTKPNIAKVSSFFVNVCNKINQIIKRNRFNKKLKNRCINTEVIVVEGDSWFEYPIGIKDITDWLDRLTNHAVYSLASGGDWLSNMSFSEDYIDKINELKPDYFMISGGGNDLIHKNHLQYLLLEKQDFDVMTFGSKDFELRSKLQKSGYTNVSILEILCGSKCINDKFPVLLKILKMLYIKMFSSVIGDNPYMKIIIHGYDFTIPSQNKNIFINPLRLILKNGKSLYKPLNDKGYIKQYEKNAIMKALIFGFNEMLSGLADKYSYVTYVDLRNTVKENEWADELHPNSKGFKKLTEKILNKL